MYEAAHHYCFLAERQVGIGSAAQGIEPYVRARAHTWCDVTYVDELRLLEPLPVPERVKGTLRGFVQVARALRRRPYDALFFLTHNPAVLHPRALAKYPTVLWTDVTPAQLDGQAEQYGHSVDRIQVVGRLKRAAVRNAFRSARLVVGWSNWARRSFVEDYGIAEDRTRVVPPGIDLARWQVPVRGPTDGLPRLLFVGGDFERKGGRLLLDVFREHFRDRAELDLVTRDAVEEEHGVRVHRGLRAGSPELMALYRDASAFVLPTQGDCFSIASLEAMAMGLPVLVSDVGGIADIVEVERSGFLMPPRDGRALRGALERLLADPQLRLGFGLRGRHLVETRFDASRSAEALLTLLRQVADTAGQRGAAPMARTVGLRASR